MNTRLSGTFSPLAGMAQTFKCVKQHSGLSGFLIPRLLVPCASLLKIMLLTTIFASNLQNLHFRPEINAVVSSPYWRRDNNYPEKLLHW